jgi:hypothetical protein
MLKKPSARSSVPTAFLRYQVIIISSFLHKRDGSFCVILHARGRSEGGQSRGEDVYDELEDGLPSVLLLFCAHSFKISFYSIFSGER